MSDEGTAGPRRGKLITAFPTARHPRKPWVKWILIGVVTAALLGAILWTYYSWAEPDATTTWNPLWR